MPLISHSFNIVAKNVAEKIAIDDEKIIEHYLPLYKTK